MRYGNVVWPVQCFIAAEIKEHNRSKIKNSAWLNLSMRASWRNLGRSPGKVSHDRNSSIIIKICCSHYDLLFLVPLATEDDALGIRLELNFILMYLLGSHLYSFTYCQTAHNNSWSPSSWKKKHLTLSHNLRGWKLSLTQSWGQATQARLAEYSVRCCQTCSGSLGDLWGCLLELIRTS